MSKSNTDGYVVRPNVKATSYTTYRNFPDPDADVEPVLSKREREEKELLEFLLKEDDNES